MMTTWKRGREILGQRLHAGIRPFADFVKEIHAQDFARVPGTAVYMYGNQRGTPPAAR